MKEVAIIVGVVVWLLYAYVIIRMTAAESLGEIRYCLRCAKGRKESICKSNPKLDSEMIQVLNNDIEYWQKKLDTHWGRKIAKGRVSSFDRIPTPEEDVEGIYLKSVLGKIKKCPWRY